MIAIQRAGDQQSVNLDWLKGRHYFSFGDYFDEANCRFGPMRVLNNDQIAPMRGFGRHPHSDMEIVSIVLQGELKHEDSLGNSEVSRANGYQRMSAGLGVLHTEHNVSETEELDILQMWFMPRERGLTPSYEAGSFEWEQASNLLHPIMSGDGREGSSVVQQDMVLYICRLEGSGSQAADRAAGSPLIRYRLDQGRRCFLFVIEGELRLNGDVRLGRRDAARIEEEQDELVFDAAAETRFMLIDLP